MVIYFVFSVLFWSIRHDILAWQPYPIQNVDFRFKSPYYYDAL